MDQMRKVYMFQSIQLIINYTIKNETNFFYIINKFINILVKLLIFIS